MPELPEVESLRRGLVRAVVGQRVRKVRVLAPKLVSGKGNVRTASAAKTRAFEQGLKGARLTAINRRAKNLLFHFGPQKIMLVHLKMTGQLVYQEKHKRPVIGGHPIELSEHELPNKHTRIIFTLTRGALYYNDTRMFGYLLYYPSRHLFETGEHFAELGLEPTDKVFTLEYFAKRIKEKSGVLKKILMDQAVVTGLGNIYADEVCFEAGVRPTRRTNTLSKVEVGKLYRAIKRIIPAAIKEGGSSVASYLLADGSRGNYARSHKVYGKSGQNCPKCRAPLTTIKLNARTTVFCKRCQK